MDSQSIPSSFSSLCLSTNRVLLVQIEDDILRLGLAPCTEPEYELRLPYNLSQNLLNQSIFSSFYTSTSSYDNQINDVYLSLRLSLVKILSKLPYNYNFLHINLIHSYLFNNNILKILYEIFLDELKCKKIFSFSSVNFSIFSSSLKNGVFVEIGSRETLIICFSHEKLLINTLQTISIGWRDLEESLSLSPSETHSILFQGHNQEILQNHLDIFTKGYKDNKEFSEVNIVEAIKKSISLCDIDSIKHVKNKILFSGIGGCIQGLCNKIIEESDQNLSQYIPPFPSHLLSFTGASLFLSLTSNINVYFKSKEDLEKYQEHDRSENYYNIFPSSYIIPNI